MSMSHNILYCQCQAIRFRERCTALNREGSQIHLRSYEHAIDGAQYHNMYRCVLKVKLSSAVHDAVHNKVRCVLLYSYLYRMIYLTRPQVQLTEQIRLGWGMSHIKFDMRAPWIEYHTLMILEDNHEAFDLSGSDMELIQATIHSNCEFEHI